MADAPDRSPGRRLRRLLAGAGVAVPGAYNALVAMQVERLGFEAVYVSGAAVSAAHGVPDIGLLTLPEMVAEARRIARAVRIPALVDADTGYGPPLVVMRTVREFEEAGAAGLQLEDQENPKRCGHLPDKRLAPIAEMAMKVAAAARARRDPDFVILARTDARAVEGLEGAIARACAYVRAGADAVFPEALETREEFERFATGLLRAGIKVPLVANMTEFGKSPALTVRELGAMGYGLVLFPVSTLRVAMRATDALLRRLQAEGSTQGSLDQMQTRQQLYELLRYRTYEQQDRELQERYGREDQG